METISISGRRKTAIARIYVSKGKGKITVNNKDYKDYFSTPVLQYKVTQPLNIVNSIDKYDIKVNLDGGGVTGQAEALRLAISKAMVQIDPECRPALKKEGFLMRDPRMVERKKPGQKKARKKFQFSKR